MPITPREAEAQIKAEEPRAREREARRRSARSRTSERRRAVEAKMAADNRRRRQDEAEASNKAAEARFGRKIAGRIQWEREYDFVEVGSGSAGVAFLIEATGRDRHRESASRRQALREAGLTSGFPEPILGHKLLQRDLVAVDPTTSELRSLGVR